MAAKKSASRAKPASSTGSGQLATLRKTVEQLRKRLAAEVDKRKIDQRLIQETRRAREEVARQVAELRKRGSKMAADLQKALSESSSRDKAAQQAREKLAALRLELSKRTEEVRKKSAELGKLAKESAERARNIITGSSSAPVHSDQPPQPVHEVIAEHHSSRAGDIEESWSEDSDDFDGDDHQ